jgi:hypothetical protein
MMNASAATVRLLHGRCRRELRYRQRAGFVLPIDCVIAFPARRHEQLFCSRRALLPTLASTDGVVSVDACRQIGACTGSCHSGFMRCARALGNASRMSTSTHVSDLTPYRNRDGNSGISAYQLLDDGIIVRFVEDGTYRYGPERPGRYHVGQMKSLAMAGRGLATYINRYVREKYEERLD